MRRSAVLRLAVAIRVRAGLGMLVLAATIAVGGHVLFRVGGVFNPARRLAPGEAQALRFATRSPVREATSARCFASAASVTAVRSHGDDVFISFTGQRRPMTIQYLRTTRAAILWSYAHGSDDNYYANTNWFHTPAHLTHSDILAMTRCIPGPP